MEFSSCIHSHFFKRTTLILQRGATLISTLSGVQLHFLCVHRIMDGFYGCDHGGFSFQMQNRAIVQWWDDRAALNRAIAQ